CETARASWARATDCPKTSPERNERPRSPARAASPDYRRGRTETAADSVSVAGPDLPPGRPSLPHNSPPRGPDTARSRSRLGDGADSDRLESTSQTPLDPSRSALQRTPL